MSLDDKFNQQGKSKLELIDHFLCDVNRKIAIKWQDKTGKSKRKLENALYTLGSASLLGSGIYEKNLTLLFCGMIPLYHSLKDARPKTTIEEDYQFDPSRNPDLFMKGASMFLYTSGILFSLSGIVRLSYSLASKDYSSVINQINEISRGVGYTSWMTASYISRSDIGQPPKKKKKKPILERIREKLGRLVVEPIPETAYTAKID